MIRNVVSSQFMLHYSFPVRDKLTGKWYRARYKAELHVIIQRDTEWMLDGLPEIRRRPDLGTSTASIGRAAKRAQTKRDNLSCRPRWSKRETRIWHDRFFS